MPPGSGSVILIILPKILRETESKLTILKKNNDLGTWLLSIYQRIIFNGHKNLHGSVINWSPGLRLRIRGSRSGSERQIYGSETLQEIIVE